MAKGIQPTPQQLAEERHITLRAATDELLRLDIPEAEQLDYLARAVAHDQALSAIVRRLQLSNRIEDADHRPAVPASFVQARQEEVPPIAQYRFV